MLDLKKYIEESEIVQAAITEAVHRYYHDRVLSDEWEKKRWSNDERQSFELSGKLLSNLWRLLPNWRYILLNKPKRYQAQANTTSIPNDPPKEKIALALNLDIKTVALKDLGTSNRINPS